jgi:hypothetical protein
VEAEALAGVKKKAKNEGRTIVFIDESGLSERPHRCRTWAPRGQTPVLQYHFNWKTLSAMAGVTWWNFYFRLFPGSIRSPQVVEFLSHLLRHIPGKVLPLRPESATSYAPSAYAGHCVLGTGRPLSTVTILCNAQ